LPRFALVGDRHGPTHVLVALSDYGAGMGRQLARRPAEHVVLLSLVVPLALGAVAGCGASDTKSSAAPPTVICGQTLIDSAAGAVLTDATTPGSVDVTDETVGGVVLKLSKSCTQGAQIVLAPPDAARVLKKATTKDGAIAGVVVSPVQRSFDITVSRAGSQPTVVHVRLKS
jgi:hypothetical protein